MNITGPSATDAKVPQTGAATFGSESSLSAHEKRDIDSSDLLGSRGTRPQQTEAETHVQPQPRTTQLSVHYDKESAKYVIKLVEVETGEVLREYPPEEMRRIAVQINRYLGMLFDKHS